MRIVRRVLRALLVFACASVVMLIATAQLAPGWQAGSEQRPLEPSPLPPTSPLPRVGPIERVEADVRREDGRPLAAWIVTPVHEAGRPRFPGVVLVHGAGAADRNALIAEAEALANSGVAAIVWDKSEQYSFVSRDFRALADDAIAAAEILARHPAVDPARVGIMAFSEGGWVAPIAAERAPHRFAFLVLGSASIVSPLEQIAWVADRPLAGAPDWLRRIPAAVLASGRPILDYLDTDITGELAALTVPVYAVWGAEDVSMPVAVAARILQSADVPVTARILPGSGHDLGAGPWVKAAAEWITGLPATAREELAGTEPTSRHGVPRLPATVWFMNPVGHAVLSLALAAGSVALPVRRPRRK